MWLLNRGSVVRRKVNGIRVGVLRRRWGYEKMCEEEVGVMRNAMTTRAPCGANNTRSINQIAKVSHTLFGLLNTHSKLLR